MKEAWDRIIFGYLDAKGVLRDCCAQECYNRHRPLVQSWMDVALAKGSLKQQIQDMKKCLKHHGISPDDYMVYGRTALYEQGFLVPGKDGLPSDIDILLFNQDDQDRLSNLPESTLRDVRTNGFSGQTVEIRCGDAGRTLIETTRHIPIKDSSPSLLQEKAVDVDGVKMISPDDQINFYIQMLRSQDVKKLFNVAKNVSSEQKGLGRHPIRKEERRGFFAPHSQVTQTVSAIPVINI